MMRVDFPGDTSHRELLLLIYSPFEICALMVKDVVAQQHVRDASRDPHHLLPSAAPNSNGKFSQDIST